MVFTPFHMQIAGVGVLVAVAAGFVWWVAHIVIGRHRGRHIEFLPDIHPDQDDDYDDTGPR